MTAADPWADVTALTTGRGRSQSYHFDVQFIFDRRIKKVWPVQDERA